MEKPPVPEKPFVVGTVTNKRLSIAWEVRGNVSQITHYSVFSRIVQEDTEDASSWEMFDTNDSVQECNFIDLTPDTSYQFRVASIANDKLSCPSEISDDIKTAKDFQAPSRSPTPQKPILDGEPTDDSIPLAWEVAEDTSNVTHYTITYKAVDKDADLELAGQWKTHNTKDARRSCLVEDLEPETPYRFVVSSNSNKGKSPPSPISNVIRTSEDPESVPMPQPPTCVGHKTHNSVPLAWDVIGNTRHITHYTVMCRKSNGKGGLLTYQTEDAMTKFTVEELNPDTDYQFRIKAHTTHGQSEPSEITSISTLRDTKCTKEQRPPTPGRPTVVGRESHNSVSLSWNIDDKNTHVTNYTIYYRKANSIGPWIMMNTESKETECTIGDLHPNTHYQFKVASNNNSGLSQQSKNCDIHTKPEPQSLPPHDIPAPQKPFQAGCVTHNSIPIAWDVIGDQRLVNQYSVTCKKAHGKGPIMTYDTENLETMYTVTDLLPATSYKFSVTLKATNGKIRLSEASDIIATNNDPINMPIFEQMPPIPQAPILAGAITHNCIPLTWNVTGSTKCIINHNLTYKKACSNGPVMIVDTRGAENSYTVENLEADTAYQFWVSINTDQGPSHLSNMSDIYKTLRDPNGHSLEQMIPLPQKPSLSGSASHKSLPLSWRVIGNTSHVTHYTLTYKKATTNAPWVMFETCSKDTQCFVYDLEPDTSYHFRVAANTDLGQSLPSAISDVISTTEDPESRSLHDHQPPKPLRPRIKGSASHNSVPLVWTVQGNTTDITHYTVSYTPIGDKAKGRWVSVETDGADKQFTVSDLDQRTSYLFRVTSNTERGQSLPSETSDLITTTKESVSAPSNREETLQLPTPKKPKATGTPSHHSITLTWKVQGSTRDITHYTVSYRKRDGQKDTWTTVETDETEKRSIIMNLDPDTSYQFRVTSNSPKGQSLPSELSDIIRTQAVPQCSPKQQPPKPSKLTKVAVTHDSLTLAWTIDGDTANVTHYTLTYRAVETETETCSQGPWSLIETHNADTWYKITNLDPCTSYEFSIAANTKDCQTYKSDLNEILTTEDEPGQCSLNKRSLVSFKSGIPVPSPSIPRLAPGHKPTKHTLSIVWDVAIGEADITHFTLHYRTVKEENWTDIQIPGQRYEYTLNGLESGNLYIVRITAHTSTDSSDPSEVGGPFETDYRTDGQMYREELIGESELTRTDKDMPIYQVPLWLTDKNEEERIQRCEFGTRPSILQQEKVILVVGATGAGKSTLVNGLLNYVIGVEWAEKVRFRLVEESGLFDNQHKSQTRVITVYTLHHDKVFQVPYTVTIIDTPGFGDTEGIDKDKLITESITHLFSNEKYGIDHIDAIGFVAQSSLARLTTSQKYIFDSILSLFGKDIGENIFLLITFSDSQKPPLLASTKEAKIPFKSHFKFNNSALFARNDTEDNEFDLMFWKMGAMSFKKFLNGLVSIEGKSLLLTKEVLDERQQLEVYVTGIQAEIRNGLTKLEQFRVEINVVKQHEAEIKRNEDFIYTVEEQKMVKVDLEPGQHVTNCMHCNRTCHYLCAYANDEDKKKCCAMDKQGLCRVCPSNCIWNLHRNVPYRIETEIMQVRKTAEDLKNRYEKAKGEKMNAEKLKDKILEDFYNLEMKVVYMTGEVRRGLERLSVIALRPNPLSAVQYLDIMINSERAEGQPGFQARINQLESVKAQAKTLDEMSADGYDPFDQYRETLKQAKSAEDRPSFQEYAADYKKKNPSAAKKFFKKVKNLFYY